LPLLDSRFGGAPLQQHPRNMDFELSKSRNMPLLWLSF
jgi:hypothetical protein